MASWVLPLTMNIDRSLILISCDSALNSGNYVNIVGAIYDICIVEHSFFKRNRNELQTQKNKHREKCTLNRISNCLALKKQKKTILNSYLMILGPVNQTVKDRYESGTKECSTCD